MNDDATSARLTNIERKIDKITFKVKEECDEDEKWIDCWPTWEEGSTELTLTWYPRARNGGLRGVFWNQGGSRSYNNIGDEISFDRHSCCRS